MTLHDGWTLPHLTTGAVSDPVLVLVLGSPSAVAAAAARADDIGAARRLILVDVGDLASGPADTALAAERLLDLLEISGVRDATLVGHTAGCAVVVRAAGQAPVGVIARVALISSPLRLPAPEGAAAALNYAADLADVTVPTLVLHSEIDVVSPLRATALGTVLASPNAQLRVYPGGNDAWSDANREAVIRDLLAFADASARC